MNKEKKLIKNTFIISIGKICTSFITFLLLPLYTYKLSTSEYGVVDLLNTLVSLLLPLVTFQIERAAFRKLIDSRNDLNKTEEIITTSFLYVIIQCVLFSLIFFIISIFISNSYKYYLLINVLVYIFFSLFQQIARGLDRINDYTVSSFLSALFTILFNLLFILAFDLKAYGMLLGTFLGQFIAFIYLLFFKKIYKYIKFKKYKRTILKILLKYSIPLIPNALAWWIFSASDRIIITSLLGVDQNGIYAAAIKFSTIITILYNIFDTSWIESVSANINDKEISSFFNKTFNYIINMFISLGFLLITSMPIVFHLMIDSKFDAGYVLVPFSILAAMFNVLQGMVAVVYAAKFDTKSIAKTSIVAAILNIIVHLSLIKFIGLYASVISTFVAFATLGIYRYIDVKNKYMKFRFDDNTIVMFLVMLSIIFVCYYINNLYLNIFSFLVTIIYSIIINKKSIKYFASLIRRKLNIN